MDTVTVLRLLKENSFATTRQVLEDVIHEFEELRRLVIQGGRVAEAVRDGTALRESDIAELIDVGQALQHRRGEPPLR